MPITDTPSNHELREAVERELLMATLRLARAINGPVIKPATLKERAGALAAVADRALKFSNAAPIEDDHHLRIIFEEEHAPSPEGEDNDGSDTAFEETTQRAVSHLEESGTLQGRRMREALWQNRAG